MIFSSVVHSPLKKCVCLPEHKVFRRLRNRFSRSNCLTLTDSFSKKSSCSIFQIIKILYTCTTFPSQKHPCGLFFLNKKNITTSLFCIMRNFSFLYFPREHQENQIIYYLEILASYITKKCVQETLNQTV